MPDYAGLCTVIREGRFERAARARQDRWGRRFFHRHVELPRHTRPSAQAFVSAALASMGWGMHLHALMALHLASGPLIERVPNTPLDVPQFWQVARAASALLDALTCVVVAVAGVALLKS